MEYKPISPKYIMNLRDSVEHAIWDEYKSYKKVEEYIELWQETIQWDNFGNIVDCDFDIQKKEDGNVDLSRTIKRINGEKLLKIAIDLGIETPDFIPMIPTFRNELKADYKNASVSFEKAFRETENDPAEAVGYANSTLESICKEILKDNRFADITTSNMTISKLVKSILKKFELNPDSPEMPKEMKAIGTSLATVTKVIEDLRSDKTLFHGQNSEKYLIDEPLYAYFVINSCATVGLFLINFYQTKFPNCEKVTIPFEISDDDLPF